MDLCFLVTISINKTTHQNCKSLTFHITINHLSRNKTPLNTILFFLSRTKAIQCVNQNMIFSHFIIFLSVIYIIVLCFFIEHICSMPLTQLPMLMSHICKQNFSNGIQRYHRTRGDHQVAYDSIITHPGQTYQIRRCLCSNLLIHYSQSATVGQNLQGWIWLLARAIYWEIGRYCE